MMFYFSIFLLSNIFLYGESFISLKPLSRVTLKNIQGLQMTSNAAPDDRGVFNKMEESFRKISFPELLTPNKVDFFTVSKLIAGQGLLLNLAVISFYFSGIDPIHSVANSFDTESLKTAFYISIVMMVTGIIFDNLPGEKFQAIARDTRIFSLRLLGRSSSPFTAALVALLVSASAAFSEELFFRGFLYNSIEQSLGTSIAFVSSSAIFGLAHFPFFGANSFLEAVLGGFFAYAYQYSNHNIAVPIAVHTLYDFSAIFFTWYFASKDLTKRLGEAEASIDMSTFQPSQVESAAGSMFLALDSNKDGFLSEQEFETGLKLMGVLPLDFTISPKVKWTKQLFDEFDKNKDGKIDYKEYQAVTKEVINKWVTMM